MKTYEQEMNLIARAIGIPSSSMKEKGIITNYSQALENALVKALLKNTEQRRELRRLNQGVRHVKSLEDQVRYLQAEIEVLNELLDREDEENSNTDPAPAPTESKETSEAYANWDMRTRYPDLKPRSAS